MNNEINKISFVDIKLKSKLIILVLFFVVNGCSSVNKKEEECYYEKPKSCQPYLEREVESRGSILALDGTVPLEGWIFYLTYFDSVEQKITEKYVKLNCKCEILYFDNKKPQELSTPFN